MDQVQSGPLKKNFRAGGHGAASWYGSSSQPAAADRVPLREGTGAAAAPEPKAPAGSAGHTNRITWWRVAEGASTRQGQVSECGNGGSNELLAM